MPFAMTDQPRLEIIKDNPIKNGLDAFRASFNTVCTDRGIPYTLDALGQLDFDSRISITSMLPPLLTDI
ncbi:hypothetical protein B0J18DRAFT_437113 [Chaetomium sp. MPI-SDFR-AT-0129]|nr:hypothetical protein B0J18DRAFT_437113 [Chaetomium sp. MPI-SDFR-AT-0129]